jgi:hypothetical protein
MIGPELRRLAQEILDRLDPAVRMAVARVAGAGPGSGSCQQVWCPVCALAAAVAGEQHPMLSVIGDHSVALLTVVRAMVDDLQAAGRPEQPPAEPEDDLAQDFPPPPAADSPSSPAPDSASPAGGDRPAHDAPPAGPGRYQHITVTFGQ